MEKLYNDKGEVAVVVSVDYGAGFSTWSDVNPMDKRYTELIFNKKFDEARKLAKSEDVYDGGIEDCVIAWIPEGTKFRIDEYDGAESLIFLNPDNYYTA